MVNYFEQALVRSGFDPAAPQADGDLPFRHYSARSRIVSWVSRNLLNNLTYTARRGLLVGMKRRGGLAWLPQPFAGFGNTPEEAFWKKRDLANLVIYDVGAFHGLLTMFFARRCLQVISYEPNSRNGERLATNVALNSLGNVLVRRVALGSRPGSATMLTPVAAPGGATISALAVARLRRSTGATLSEEISITTLDRDIREFSLPAPALIKIDVEGGELAVLAGACDTLLRYRPQLFIENHGETMNQKRRNAAAVVEYLRAMGYRDIRHVESNAAIDCGNTDSAARGHIYCKYGEAGQRTDAAGV